MSFSSHVSVLEILSRAPPLMLQAYALQVSSHRHCPPRSVAQMPLELGEHRVSASVLDLGLVGLDKQAIGTHETNVLVFAGEAEAGGMLNGGIGGQGGMPFSSYVGRPRFEGHDGCKRSIAPCSFNSS